MYGHVDLVTAKQSDSEQSPICAQGLCKGHS